MKATILGTSAPERTAAVMYTVSVDPSGLREQAILAGLAWAQAHFSTVVPVVGDGPLIQRTAKITGADQTRVSQSAQSLSDRLPGVVRMSELAAVHDFLEALDRVQGSVRRLSQLHHAVETDALAYVRRVERRGDLAISFEDAAVLSREYVELELAMYLCMASRGYLVDVYVGSELPILKRFIKGDFGDVLTPLERRTFIGLELEPGP